MVAVPRFLSLSRSGLPLIGGAAAGVLVLGAVLATPQVMLEAGIWRSGIAALVPAAHPPLGATARLLLAASGALGAAAVAWSVLYLIFGAGGPWAEAAPVRSAPVRSVRKPGQRRADRHPDAPPRPPMRAADLGTPLMEVAHEPCFAERPSAEPLPAELPVFEAWPAEQLLVKSSPVEMPLPSDLDTPLAAFDPAALPPEPRAPVRPVAPLAHAPRAALAPGERLETFPLQRFVTSPDASPAPPGPAAQPSVEALLQRLEEKAARRGGIQASG